MSTIFTLTTPANVGTLGSPVVVSALAVTSVFFTSTPAMAPLGTGQLNVTLTETTSGWQETIRYQDATVIAFFGQAAPTPAAGATYQDVMSAAVFSKLIADGKLPPGTVTTTAG
jgi:hypothetical protein